MNARESNWIRNWSTRFNANYPQHDSGVQIIFTRASFLHQIQRLWLRRWLRLNTIKQHTHTTRPSYLYPIWIKYQMNQANASNSRRRRRTAEDTTNRRRNARLRYSQEHDTVYNRRTPLGFSPQAPTPQRPTPNVLRRFWETQENNNVARDLSFNAGMFSILFYFGSCSWFFISSCLTLFHFHQSFPVAVLSGI